MKNWIVYAVAGVCLITMGCRKSIDPKPETLKALFAGGETTIFSTGPDAFTFPLANLNSDGLSKHFVADGVFGQHFVTAPAIQFGGLGPLYNQNSCEGCHLRNGRGTIDAYDGDPNSGLLLRLSLPGSGPHGEPLPVPGFGGQLQNKTTFGTLPEGTVSRTEVSEIVRFLDGPSVSLTRPTYSVQDPYLPLPVQTLISPRNAPPVHGLGLLEAIPEADILALADELDTDGDGISGKANQVWNVLENRLTPGRFGWKAGQPTAAQQAAGAAHNDMGLTSPYFQTEHCDGQSNCNSGLSSGLDIDAETVDLLAFYFQTLAVPAARDLEAPIIQDGEKLFLEANCQSCHVAQFTTGPHDIQALSGQTIFPYTDLLLHDMGEGLADNRSEFLANGREWRTAPLWGVGLTQVINEKATFLHDGRAKTIEEAILWHGGEAEPSKNFYAQLSQEDREKLVAFVSAL